MTASLVRLGELRFLCTVEATLLSNPSLPPKERKKEITNENSFFK